MLTSCVLDKLFLLSFSWFQLTKKPGIIYLFGFRCFCLVWVSFQVHNEETRVVEIDLGSVWLQTGKTELCFQLRHGRTYTSPVLRKTNLKHLGRCVFTWRAKCDTQIQMVFPLGKNVLWHLMTSELQPSKEPGFWAVLLQHAVQIPSEMGFGRWGRAEGFTWTYIGGRDPFGWDRNPDEAAYVRWDYKEKEKHT